MLLVQYKLHLSFEITKTIPVLSLGFAFRTTPSTHFHLSDGLHHMVHYTQMLMLVSYVGRCNTAAKDTFTFQRTYTFSFAQYPL